MLSFLSPCVLPLVPGYVSMVSGLSAAELTDVGPDRSAPASVAVPVGASVGATAPSTPGPSAGTAEEPSDGSSKSSIAAATDATSNRVVRTKLLRGILTFIAGFTVIFVILGA